MQTPIMGKENEDFQKNVSRKSQAELLTWNEGHFCVCERLGQIRRRHGGFIDRESVQALSFARIE